MKRIIVFLAMTFTMLAHAQNTSPVLKNFRIENNQPARVYFDSSSDITGLTTTGFVISGKSISSVIVNGTSTTGHYFTVSVPFTFWDNNTIRLGEHTNTADVNPKLHNFTIQYITNNINEPTPTSTVYANLTTLGNGSGSSAANAKTLQSALIAATPGQKILVKAGNYGSTSYVISKSGNSKNPIWIVGYNETDGENPSFVRSQTTTFDGSKMPLITTSSKSGNGLSGYSIKYLILRNFQVEGFENGIKIGGYTDNMVVENVYVKNQGYFGILIGSWAAFNNRIISSYVLNSSANGISIEGNRNMIYDGYVASKGTPNMDYYISVYGAADGSNDNIIRNCEIIRDPIDTHGGHGISIKGQDNQIYRTLRTLIENCKLSEVDQAIELRHTGCQYSVIRNCIGIGDRNSNNNFITFRDNTSYNIVENGIADGVNTAVLFNDNAGEGGIQAGGHHNIIINTIFKNPKFHIIINGIGGTPLESTYNQFINCTFYGGDYLFSGPVNFGNSNQIINSTIENVKHLKTNWTNGAITASFSFSNFYNGFIPIKGEGNISVEPKFQNPSQGDFRLNPDSPLINKGKSLHGVFTDFEGNPRPTGTSHDIGAFEYQDKTSSSIKADAGKDQSICSGSSAVLTASGGSSYKWSTGATTKTITVSPKTTTTYSVTVSEGASSGSDEVLVTVKALPVANASADVSIETGQSTTLTASGGDTYLWSNGATTASITVNPIATTSYEVTVNKNGCTSKDSVTVTVTGSGVPPATVTADAGKDQTICSGSSATLTASGGSSYKWSSGATTKSITVSPISTTTYSVTVSEGASSGTDEVIVTVNALPVANAGADVSIEAGQSTTLTASGGDTYLWSTGETTASITVKPASSMIYEVKVTKNGCESSDSVKVSVNNASTGSGIVADAGKDVSICSGSNAVLTASGGSVYSWSNGSSGNTIVVSPDKTTIYTLTVSDGVNTAIDDVTVTVQALPVANAGADVSIDAGGSTTLIASGGDTYLWSTGETTASITVKPDFSTNFDVTVTSGGCSSTDTVTVSVNGSAPPASNIVADAGQDIIICKGNSAVLTASGGSSYIWSKGEKTKSIVVSPEKTTTYSVTVFDGSSSNTADVTVYVTDLPVASAGNDITIEAGQSVVLTASGGDNYTWSTGETTKEITVNPLVNTIYEVIVGKNGCESTDKVQVTVKEVPPAAANAGSDLTICKGESITLSGDGGATYSWSTGATGQNITVSPTRTTTYTLTANRGGTTNTDEVTVTVINCNLNNGVNNSVSGTTGNPATNDTAEQDDAQILNKADFELTVYPNPTEGKLNVQTTIPIYNFNLVLMNINGNVIYSDEMDAKEDGINKEIDLSRFAKGVYLLQLYNAEESYVKKVIVI